MTIFAEDVDEKVLVFLGHRCHQNLIVKIIPKLLHVQHRLLARRTRVISRHQQLLKAGPVQ